ncbi:hypothetical protein ALT721_1540052 [Alteromonas alvinellae]
MQQPADIGGQLLGFRSGQHHAVIQRVQEAALTDPLLFIHQNTVHHRDLAGGTAKAQDGDPQPDTHGLPEGDVMAESIEVTSGRIPGDLIGPAAWRCR